MQTFIAVFIPWLKKLRSPWKRAVMQHRSLLMRHRREQIIFTKGTTEGINLVAGTWGRQNIKAGDEIIVSNIEHHSNIVPWQILAEEKGAILKVIPVNEKVN